MTSNGHPVCYGHLLLSKIEISPPVAEDAWFDKPVLSEPFILRDPQDERCESKGSP